MDVQGHCHRDGGEQYLSGTEVSGAYRADVAQYHCTEASRSRCGDEIGGLQWVAMLKTNVLCLLRIAVRGVSRRREAPAREGRLRAFWR
jgi:hypothetical protein